MPTRSPARGRLRRRRKSKPTQPNPVMVHLYDVTGNFAIRHVNCILSDIGTGAFHAGVEICGEEWSYGYTEEGTGVFCVPPRGSENHTYRQSLEMGETDMQPEDVQALIERLRETWIGRDYDLLRHNCCHFSDELCKELGVGPVPVWVTNLAGAGATLNGGVWEVASKAQSAAIIAAAKAGEIDERYQIRGAVGSRAQDILAKTRVLDKEYRVSQIAGCAAATVVLMSCSLAVAAVEKAAPYASEALDRSGWVALRAVEEASSAFQQLAWFGATNAAGVERGAIDPSADQATGVVPRDG